MPADRWKCDLIQFARLIAEAEANGAFADGAVWLELMDSMDLRDSELIELIDRAQKAWTDASSPEGMAREERWVVYNADDDELWPGVYASRYAAEFQAKRLSAVGMNVRVLSLGFVAEPTRCVRCGNPLHRDRCTSLACPFHDVGQDDENGWIGHPDHPQIGD